MNLVFFLDLFKVISISNHKRLNFCQFICWASDKEVLHKLIHKVELQANKNQPLYHRLCQK
jgi:hypothetical protein